MDVHLNVTYVTFGGHVELGKYRGFYFVLMFTAYVLIVCSNSTIVYLIWHHRNLHEPMYIFIAALSVNSVLFSTAIYPKLLIDFLSDRQIISYSACLFQWFIFYSLAGSDFLLLAAMAYDRYVSICKPLQYPNIMRRATVCVFLGVAWLLPAFEVAMARVINANKELCGFVLTGVFCNNAIDKLYCLISKALDIYGLVAFSNIAILPVFFILFTYTKIFIIAHRSGGEVQKKAAETCLPHLLVLTTYSCVCSYDIVIIVLESPLPKVVHFIMTLQIILYNPLFNPVIYGLKMKEISKRLKRLFCRDKLK